ncbi:MAG TPA: SAM-dependent methyltransferase [Thermoanaerobaculia bacterium]|jgi:SAM-dependent methyltransferase
MTLIFRSEEEHPLLVAFGLSTGRLARLNRNIDAEDEMLHQYLNLSGRNRDRALVQYFDSGRRLWETMAAILRWRFGDLDRVRVLDFASGYGRVTRHAVLDVAPEQLWVADIYAAGVRFQEEELGVHGLISHADPDRFECAETFDAVLVSSLFTHLPEATFRSWLGRLWRLLRPGGVLVFSVHDEVLLPSGAALPPSGMLFDLKSESGSLPGEEYGTSWVSEAFVRRVLRDLAPRASAHRVPRGLVNFQDLWVVVPEPDQDFSRLRVRAEPEGFVEHCSAPARHLRMAGWVVDRTLRQPPRELRLRIGGDVRLAVREFQPRPEVSALFPYEDVTGYGWRFEAEVPASALERGAALELEVVDAAGGTSTLYADTIAAALLRSARLDKHALEDRLQEQATARDAERAEEARRVDALHGTIGELETRIAAMRASRFWKLRNAWFRVKRKLGLTEEV